MICRRGMLGVALIVLLLTPDAVDAKKKKDAKKQKTKGETSVSYGGAEKDGFVSGESDAEFLKRLTGSDTPQAQRIVTGKDPRYKDGAPKAEAPRMVCGLSRAHVRVPAAANFHFTVDGCALPDVRIYLRAKSRPLRRETLILGKALKRRRSSSRYGRRLIRRCAERYRRHWRNST